jgi:hypothetical protein
MIVAVSSRFPTMRPSGDGFAVLGSRLDPLLCAL